MSMLADCVEPRAPVVFALHTHLRALMSHNPPERKCNKYERERERLARDTCANEYWCDLRGCLLGHKNADKQTRLVETVPLLAPEAYDLRCSGCMADNPRDEDAIAVCITPDVAARLVVHGPLEVKAVRDTWIAARDAIQAALDAVDLRLTIGTTKMVFVVHRDVTRAERSAWFVYAAVMFDFVRLALYRPAGKRTAAHATYVDQVRDFCADQRTRVKSTTGIPRIWCITHGAIGHAMPRLGGADCHERYRSCIVCPRKL